MASTKTRTPKRSRSERTADTYAAITARILERLEEGTVPWHKPWTALDVPRSLSTGKPYNGINALVLASSCYSSPWWGTYNAIKAAGGQVRGKEKGTAIVFWKFLDKPANEETGEDARRIPMLRSFVVFNAEQADGLTLPALPEPSTVDPIDRAEEIFEGMPNRPPVSFGGDRACYSPTLDAVRLPLRSSFESAEAFYSTAYHELVHSTMHATRLNRTEAAGHSFGTADYSREELVAELGAAFLMGAAGIVDESQECQSAAYIAGWMRALEQDPKLIVQAAGKAQRAADYISPPVELEEPEEPAPVAAGVDLDAI